MNYRKFLKKALKAAADAEGWDWWETKKGFMFAPPGDKNLISAHKTVSDHRAQDNLKARLKKAGLNL